MKSLTRRGVRFGLVACLVATGLVGVTSLPAAGTGDRPLVDYGTIRLDLADRAGTLTFVRAAAFGSATFTQPLTTGGVCSTLVAGDVLDSSANAPKPGLNLLNFSANVVGGSSPNVQLPSNGIGVTDGANCGEPSGLVGPGETLTLTLGGFVQALQPDVKIGTGTLQIGKSRGSDGDLLLAYDTVTLPTTATPVSVGVRPVSIVKAGGFTSISIGSDAIQSSRGLSLRSTTVFNLVAPEPAVAPGSPTDVTAVRGDTTAQVSWTAPSTGTSPITYELRYYTTLAPATKISVTVVPATATAQTVNGLENGTEYTFEVRALNTAGQSEWVASNPVTPILFVERAQTVNCGGTSELTDEGAVGLLAAASGTFDRLNNNKDDAECVPVNVTIEITEDLVFWINEPLAGQQVQALFTVEWAGTTVPSDLDRQIDFDADGGETDFVDMPWCVSFNPATDTAELPLVADVSPLDAGESWVNSDGTVPWCLVSNSEVLEGNKIVQTQTLFGSGDPWAR